ncbi:MAG: low affinity iron permease family protein [Bacteroidota bacterium]
MKKTKKNKTSFFETFAQKVTAVTGSTGTFISACTLILVWLISGPLFDYSETWQLIINTGTTIITFLMVFLIQKTQNKDSLAIQLKLNELVAAHEHASNRLVSVEDLTEDELQILKKFYSKLALLAIKESDMHVTHSIDEAQKVHEKKKKLSGATAKTK